MNRIATVYICPHCGDHLRLETEYTDHKENCTLNPESRSCTTCDKGEDGKCSLGLIPVDFKAKTNTARHCSSHSRRADIIPL